MQYYCLLILLVDSYITPNLSLLVFLLMLLLLLRLLLLKLTTNYC